MQLGMFMMPLHDPKRDYLTVLREDQESVVLADRLGFSEVWCGEHLSSTAEPISSPLMFFSTLIAQTKRIRFGTGVLNLPQIHPATVAAYAAMFDHLCEGRFLMGIGPGGLISDFELLGLTDRQERNEMMLESIDTILRLWAQEPPYEIAGKHWPISLKRAVFPELGVGVMSKPYQKPHPPIFMSIVTPRSSSARLAAERGWRPISANFIQARYIRSHWEAYAEGCGNVGRRPDPSVWRIARSILVSDSDQHADDYLSDPDAGTSFYFNYYYTTFKARGVLELLKPDPATPDDAVTVRDIARSMVVAGSPKRVLDQLVALHDDFGDFGTLLCMGHDWDDAALWRRSMTLLAEQVMPRFRDHVASCRAAE